MFQTTRWSAERVLALAPDAAAQRAARAMGTAKGWSEVGHCEPDDAPPTVWGLAQGSGPLPYQVCVELAAPAYRCSCPSRKLPCKHVLGLLLRWVGGTVADAAPPTWVKEWLAARAARAAAGERASDQPAAAAGETGEAGPAGAEGPVVRAAARGPSERARARRAERVAGGLDELDRWLADQARAGLAGLARAGPGHWDAMAARLVDAQATYVAGAVRRLAQVAHVPERLLGELAQLHLLAAGYRGRDALPDDLSATVRVRAGLPLPTDEVLAGPPVRDRWQVLGARDEVDDQLLIRRTWLHGEFTGRPALVLSFTGVGLPLPTELAPGTEVDANLCFYPGGRPVRALVAERHAPAEPLTGVAGGSSIAVMLRQHAEALAADPWLEQWPAVLAGVVPVRADGGWFVCEQDGTGLPVDRAVGDPWRLVAVAGGRPVTAAGEWSAAGFRPLTAWADGRLVAV